MSLKASPKPNIPYKISALKSPLRPASLPPSEPALHPPQASQTHGSPPPVGSRPRGAAPSDETRPRAPLRPIRSKPPLHTGCRPTRSGKARGPLRPISGPRRCCPRCRRESARLRDLPRCGDPLPCDIHPLGQSTHRENKNLGIFATFLRLRTLPCPRKAKKEPSHGKLPAFLRLNPQLGSSQ